MSEKVIMMKVLIFFFFSSRRRHTRFDCDWSSDVCSSDLPDSAAPVVRVQPQFAPPKKAQPVGVVEICAVTGAKPRRRIAASGTHSTADLPLDRKSVV